MDISNSIYGKVFDDFIDEVKTQKKVKPFNELENDFFNMINNLKIEERHSCINGWRDYVQGLINDFNLNKTNNPNFLSEEGYRYFIDYQKRIVNDNYFKPENQNHPILGEGFFKLKSCLNVFSKRRKLTKADFSFLWHKLKSELNCSGEQYMSWVNSEYFFNTRFNRIKSLSDINPSGEHYEREKLYREGLNEI